jgi:hypothetical protein
MRRLTHYWGYAAFLALVVAWTTAGVRPAALLVLSLAVTAYFLFQAPGRCGVPAADGSLCPGDTGGLLLGCSPGRHRWRKLGMAVRPRQWPRLKRACWATPRDAVSTAAAAAGLVSAVAAAALLALR